MVEKVITIKSSFITVFLVLIGIALLSYNQFMIFQISSNVGMTGTNTGSFIASAADVIPRGIPDVYGQELGVSYDDVSPNDPAKADATIKKLSAYEGDTLTGDTLQRYIKIGKSISCEYCCGAQSLIFDNGQAACGCAHSYAMRGLAKYLLQNHPDMTDDQILEELGKWKTLFFPGILTQKAEVLKQQGIELNYINLASNKYRGIEKGSSEGGGGMVGGC